MIYFSAYSEQIKAQILSLLKSGQLSRYFLNKYPEKHQLKSEKQLFEYTNKLKQHYLKHAAKLDSVKYHKQQDLVLNALGTHTFKRHQQGNRLRAQHHIAISNQLKDAPEPIIRALIVHELAHFREKEHNKNFYRLSCHMEPNYYQLELDLRLFSVMLMLYDNPYQ